MKRKSIILAAAAASLIALIGVWGSISSANAKIAKGEAIVSRYLAERDREGTKQTVSPGTRSYVDFLISARMGDVPGFFLEPCRYACTESEREAVFAFISKELERAGYFEQFEREPQDVPEAKAPR